MFIILIMEDVSQNKEGLFFKIQNKISKINELNPLSRFFTFVGISFLFVCILFPFLFHFQYSLWPRVATFELHFYTGIMTIWVIITGVTLLYFLFNYDKINNYYTQKSKIAKFIILLIAFVVIIFWRFFIG